MDPRLTEALRWHCSACEALVDETHPRLYRRSDGNGGHTYAGDNGIGEHSPALALLLPIDDGTARTPLDVGDLAVLLAVQTATVYKWRTRGVVPTEDGRVSDQPYWWPQTIERWATETRRWPGYVAGQ